MMNEVYDRFLGLERRERLMQRTVGGVPYWHLVRFNVYTRSVLPLFVKMDAAHPDFDPVASPRRSLLRRAAGKLRRWAMSALAATVRNPRLVFRRRDVLFSLINAARLYKIRPDNALEQTNLNFIRRFNYLEAKAKEQGRELKDLSLAEMDALWQEAKGMNNQEC